MHRSITKFRSLLLLGALTAPAAPAAICEARSGATTAALIELYTSEGCDSCPPADRWLADLRAGELGPERLIPLALHVDYWNDLGWIDPYAQAKFSQRQRELAQRNGGGTVYTPEFLLNGKEYRRWPWNEFKTDAARINNTPARADIYLRLEPASRKLRMAGTASLKPRSEAADLFLALTESNLKSEVGAGENRGRHLEHQFVVRQLLGPLAIDKSGGVHFDQSLALATDWKIDDLGVVAFVQARDSTEILQALARPWCR